MTGALFEFPENAVFGRILPKSKIYEHARPTTAIKELFVTQVDQIVWQYKLAPETINIKSTPSVPEIQVFNVTLKNGEIKHEVLRCIDRAISFPILYELKFEDKIKAVAAYKRQNEVDATKWILSEYFEGKWQSADTARKALPLVFDLEVLYAQLLARLLPYQARPGESLKAQVERIELIRTRKREQERHEARLRNEKQFNRKVEINAELRKLKQELDELTGSLS